MLISCKECNAQISTKAKTCPSCGADRTPIEWKVFVAGMDIFLGLFFGVLFLMALFYFMRFL
ncbi:zinc-ribbon domain-containing protein [Celeribacter halophilus]|uniref:zinc-ribbon domain-containing protein n=1 Tax=Celeribacter halophilus TaxID=576117 RepID=UPI003F6FBBA2